VYNESSFLHKKIHSIDDWVGHGKKSKNVVNVLAAVYYEAALIFDMSACGRTDDL